jgi:1-acyl-sn-glycerol-3-phosphate acyltransferase
MIEAEHKKWAKLIFDPYINRLLRKNFNNFYVAGDLPDLDKYPGLIITPNHFSWWDGFLTSYLIRKLTRKKVYTMMLEDQLNRYWFFKKVGAFSINPSNPVSMVRTLDYTRNILKDKENIIVLYPQGEIQPLTSDDIIIKPGLKLILQEDPVEKYVLPLALKIEYGRDKKPDVAASFGRMISAEKIKEDLKEYNREFITTIKKLKTISNFETCRNLF